MRKRNIKKFLSSIIFLGIMSMTNIVLAQPNMEMMQRKQGERQEAPSIDNIIDKMKQELVLTDEQTIKITPIIQKEIQKMNLLMKDMMGQKPDMDTMGEKIKSIREETEKSLSQYLTAEQLKKWQERKQMRGQGRERGQSRGKGDEN